MKISVKKFLRPGFWIAAGFLLAVSSALAAEVRFEHSGGSSWGTEGGSSWGTENALRAALTLNENEVPLRYRSPAENRPVQFVKVNEMPMAAGRFDQDEVALYSSLTVCLDASLPAPDSHLEEAKEVFLNAAAGREENGRLFTLSFEALPTRGEEAGVPARCDILAVRGSWSSFPFSRLPKPAAGAPSRYGQIYGLYYRFNEKSVPVITLHPDAEISFAPADGRYVTETSRGLLVDGRTLLLHEVGHILGFAHIQPGQGTFDHPEATAMGIDEKHRDGPALNLRFAAARDLWKYWDSYQTTIYRRAYLKHLIVDCEAGHPYFRTLAEKAARSLARYHNFDLEREKPLGAFPVSPAAVAAALKAATGDFARFVCREYPRFRDISINIVYTKASPANGTSFNRRVDIKGPDQTITAPIVEVDPAGASRANP